jgi:RNA polymerase sigma-70 factor (ECF subfamily)
VSEESRELIQRASRGDSVAADALLERHLPGLRQYVRARISPALLAKESSSDVVQSVCRELLAGFDRFEYRGEGAFRSWLYQAAMRKLVDHMEYHEADKRGGPAPTGSSLSEAESALLASSLSTPSNEAMRAEDLQALERGFAQLSESDRRILRMAHLEGRSHAEIAEQLGLTEVSSRKQLSRALARLARKLG